MDNIRLVTNVVQDANLHSRPICLLSLDIYKAFDGVNWSYLNHLLPKFGISDKCIHKFNALYHSPQPRIQIPSNNSNFFPLSRGTRQGCPLYPLLFALRTLQVIAYINALLMTHPVNLVTITTYCITNVQYYTTVY